MSCTETLTERLIEISSKPLHKYSYKVHSHYDPLDWENDYVTHQYEWAISNRKRLVVKTHQAAEVHKQSVTSIWVQHRFGILRWMERIDKSIIPDRVVETIRQFAMDGEKEYSAKNNARVDADACEQALKSLS